MKFILVCVRIDCMCNALTQKGGDSVYWHWYKVILKAGRRKVIIRNIISQMLK